MRCIEDPTSISSKPYDDPEWLIPNVIRREGTSRMTVFTEKSIRYWLFNLSSWTLDVDVYLFLDRVTGDDPVYELSNEGARVFVEI